MTRVDGYGGDRQTLLKRAQQILFGFVVGFCFAYGTYIAFNTVSLSKTNRLADRVKSCSCDRSWGERPSSAESNGRIIEIEQPLDRLPNKEEQDNSNGSNRVLELSKEIRNLLNFSNTSGSLNIQLKDRLKSLETILAKPLHVIESTTSKTKTIPQKERTVIEDERLHKDDYSVADELYRKVRVLCWVMTQPANLETRARHIKNTWGKRCHKLLFFSSVANETFPTIALNTSFEARSQLNRKTIAAFQYVYKHYWNDYDWFMRTDDDAYVIMENLRYFLSEQDPNGVYYFGHHFKTIVPGGYFSGGPGIVLGREALKRYAAASKTSECFQGESFADDAELGKCLHKVGIKPGNSTDRLGRSRFHCFDPGTHVMKFYPDWFYAYDANGAHGGRDSMSDYAIGFHYVNDWKINELEYYVYHLRPYGVKFADQNLNQKPIPTS